MRIYYTLTLPMLKRDQRKIGEIFQKATAGKGSRAIICEARVFHPALAGVWRMDPQWKIAVVDKELFQKINALLVEANTGKKPCR